MPPNEAIDDVYHRTLARFASKAAVTEAANLEDSSIRTEKNASEQENVPGDNMPAVAAVKKTAEGEVKDNGTGGSQVMTFNDPGDYGTASEALNLQKKELADHAPDNTETLGNPNLSMKTDDKSYPQGGAGAAKLSAKNKALAAVISIASVDPKAAARLLRATDELGTELGGPPAGLGDDKPNSGPGADTSMSPDPMADPVPTPPVAAVPGDSVTQVKLQETIQDKQQAMDIEKQVVTELSKVLDDVTVGTKEEDEKAKKDKEKKEKDKKEAASKDDKKDKEEKKDKKEAASKEDDAKDKKDKEKKEKDKKEAASDKDDKKDKEEKKEKKDKKEAAVSEEFDEDGNRKVFHTSRDQEDYPLSDGDPTKNGFEQSKLSSEKNRVPAAGQEYAETGDRDYKLARKQFVEIRQAVQNRVTALIAGGIKKTSAIMAVKDAPLGRRYRLASLRWQKCELKRTVTAKVATLKKAGASLEDALKMAAKTPEAQRLLAVNKKLAENESPDDMVAKGEETTRYDSADKGDTKDDEISEGTDPVLESPETGAVANSADSQLNSKHNSDISGSSIASVKARIASELKPLKTAISALQAIAKECESSFVTKASREAFSMVTLSALKSLQKSAEDLVAAEQQEAFTPSEKVELVASIRTARTNLALAKSAAVLARATKASVGAMRDKLAKVSPSFKLATHMVKAGMIHFDDLPAKVSEFVQMSDAEFKVAQNMATTLAATVTRSMPKQASRLPSILTEGSAMSPMKDELDGVFDD